MHPKVFLYRMPFPPRNPPYFCAWVPTEDMLACMPLHHHYMVECPTGHTRSFRRRFSANHLTGAIQTLN